MKQNLALAFLYNSLGVPVAAGVLYPVLGILLSPMFAALAMILSSVSVVVNALRLRIVALHSAWRRRWSSRSHTQARNCGPRCVSNYE